MSKKKNKTRPKPRSQWSTADFHAAVRQEVRRSILVDVIFHAGGIIRTFVRGFWVTTTIGLIVWGAVQISPDLAGKEMRVVVIGRALMDIALGKWAYLLIIGLLGGGWGISTKTGKRRIASLSRDNKALELMIDPARSSSGLRQDGTQESE